jgi:hypothetical protein
MDGFTHALERPRLFDDQKGAEYLTRMIEGSLETPAGIIPVFRSRYGLNEAAHRVWLRFGFGRKRFRIPPGLYAVGNPAENAPVLVTCNYKMTVDLLRRDLSGHSAWILVLNTDGINVWCAAGKGTFCTAEVLYWIEKTKLAILVRRKILVMPQLGAPGIEPHLIRRYSGFKVSYGPVRSEDLPVFLSGEPVTEKMRQVRFNTFDRLEVAILEMVRNLGVSVVLWGLGALWEGGHGLVWLGSVCAASTIAGSFLVPLLMPVMPFRGFGLNGAAFFIPLGAVLYWFGAPLWMLLPGMTYAVWQAINFTGSTTLTSYTAVKTEIRSMRLLLALPLITGILMGIASWSQ